MQIIGDYGVPAIVCAVSRHIPIFIICTAACAGYGGDAIASYSQAFVKTNGITPMSDELLRTTL